jgi:hypothetical protein
LAGDADGWGFEDQAWIATTLQGFAMKHIKASTQSMAWDEIKRGLNLLSLIIADSELECRKKLATVEFIESINARG